MLQAPTTPSCSVCHLIATRSCFVSKRVNMSSHSFHCRVATLFQFFVPHLMAIFRWRTPSHNGGVECRWGMKKSRFSTNISRWNDCWSVEYCQQISTVEYVDNKRRLRLYQSTVTSKRTEQSLFACLGNSEAEVTYSKCIGDDTKAAACQSLNCIKNKKK